MLSSIKSMGDPELVRNFLILRIIETHGQKSNTPLYMVHEIQICLKIHDKPQSKKSGGLLKWTNKYCENGLR